MITLEVLRVILILLSQKIIIIYVAFCACHLLSCIATKQPLGHVWLAKTDQPALPHSHIRVFTDCRKNLSSLGYPKSVKWGFTSGCMDGQAQLNVGTSGMSEGSFCQTEASVLHHFISPLSTETYLSHLSWINLDQITWNL